MTSAPLSLTETLLRAQSQFEKLISGASENTPATSLQKWHSLRPRCAFFSLGHLRSRSNTAEKISSGHYERWQVFSEALKEPRWKRRATARTRSGPYAVNAKQRSTLFLKQPSLTLWGD